MITNPRRFLPLLALLASSVGSCLAQSVITHHVRDVVRNGNAQATGRLPNNQVLQLDLVLPLRDPAGLKTFLADVYNPSSPNYREFLTLPNSPPASAPPNRTTTRSSALRPPMACRWSAAPVMAWRSR